MLPSRFLSDPEKEFKKHWEWHEITWEAAIMRCSFVPVIMTSNSSGKCEVTWLSPSWLPGIPIVPHVQQRYFVQVGTGKAAGPVSPVKRDMALSAAGADFIGLGYENPRKDGLDEATGKWFPHDDGVGYPTIGYGHKIKHGENFSSGLTLDQVQDLFRQDQRTYVEAVNNHLKVGVSQNQFDALVSLDFNVGSDQKAPGWTKKHPKTRPTLPIRRLNQGLAVSESNFTDYANAHDRKHGNKLVRLKGLATRRKAEWKIFKDGIYDSRH